MPSSDDDIRWPWESNDDNSPQPRTPQNSPHGTDRYGSAKNSYVVQTGTHTNPRERENEEYGRFYLSKSPPGQQMEHQNFGRQSVLLEVFVQEMLQAHNDHRSRHQAPPLKLDKKLMDGAQRWAETLASRDRLEPDMSVDNSHIGENLAMKYNSHRTDFSGKQFTDYWYSGIADYDFSTHSPRLHRGSGALSFTQLVWKATWMVGFGRAVSRQGRVFVVGRYYPGGNSTEGFASNVLPEMSRDARLSGRDQDRDNSSKTAAVRATGSRVSEYMDAQPSAAIGAMRPSDTLVSTSKSTEYLTDRTVVMFEEKYRTPDGSTYTRQKKTTFYGEQRPRD